MTRSARLALLAIVAALLLSGCGVFGGDAPRQAATADVDESRTVRVNSGDRFFDIDPSSLLDFEGNL